MAVATGPEILSVDPTTEETLARFASFTPEHARAALDEAHHAFGGWRRTTFAERAVLLRSLAVILRARKDFYALLMTQEMGKPITEARAEIEKCAWNCDFYAEN